MNRNVASRTYYIRVTNKRVIPVYCKMENTVECGKGGWTLAMKIDGHKVHEGVAFPEFIGLPYSI